MVNFCHNFIILKKSSVNTWSINIYMNLLDIGNIAKFVTGVISYNLGTTIWQLNAIFACKMEKQNWRHIFLSKHTSTYRVFIHKSRGEVSLVEQDIIDYVSTVYFEPKKNQKLIFIKEILNMQLFSGDATIFFLPQKIKNCPQKLLIIPQDHEFSVQQVFSLWNWDSFLVWLFLIFEVVKLCRIKIKSPDST